MLRGLKNGYNGCFTANGIGIFTRRCQVDLNCFIREIYDNNFSKCNRNVTFIYFLCIGSISSNQDDLKYL